MYTLVIPKIPSLKEKKSGGGSPFWQPFWEKKVSERPDYYRKIYNKRQQKLSQISNTLNTINQKPGKKYYLEAKIDELATSKSKEPEMIWKESGIKIVETKDDGTITLSGYSEDYKKLNEIFEKASFEKASEIKKVRKENNLSREVFTVTSISDNNSTKDKRTSNTLRSLLLQDPITPIKTILTVHYDQEISNYDKFFLKLSQKVGNGKIKKINPDFFINNMSFRATLNNNDIEKILSNDECNFINFIKLSPIYGSQRTIPNEIKKNLTIGTLLTEEQVVIIDSGIDHPSINQLVTQTENLLPSGKITNKNHGTSVASKLLFGNDFFSKVQRGETINPTSKIINLEVGNDNIDDETLQKAIRNGVVKYKDKASIYNLSITSFKQIDEKEVSETTEMIDDLSNKNDILFICATGNHSGDFALPYEEIFNNKNVECNISSPSDAINALTVGSITDLADEQCICKTKKFPSPFTRKGGLRNDIKKPELVAIGGNVQIDPNKLYDKNHLENSEKKYGVPLINTNGFTREVGTSFSTPLVSKDCLLLLDYLKKTDLPKQLNNFNENKANLVKALMIHSTSRTKQSVIDDIGIKRAYGFGEPSLPGVLQDNDNQITMIYTDEINFSEKKQKIVISIPEELKNIQAEFTFTLVYNPPVNKNFSEYKMIRLQPSIGFVEPEIKEGTPTGKNKFTPINPPHSWDSYRSKHFNTTHFSKNRKITKLDFQIIVQMLVSNRLLDEYIGKEEENITQKYALVLTIKDKGENGTLRNVLLNSNQFHELIENVVQVQT